MARNLPQCGPDIALPPAVVTAAGRLPRRSAVRQVVEAVSPAGSDDAFRALVDALDPKQRRRLRERIVCARALPWLTRSPDRRAQAIDALATAARQPHLVGSRLTTGRTGKVFSIVGVALPSTLLVVAVLSMALYALDLPYQFLLIPAVPAFIGTILVGALSAALSLSKERSAQLVVASLDGLGQLRAVEALGAVVEQLHFPTTTPVQPAARRAIETIAPAVSDEHYGAVPKSALMAICRQRTLLASEDVIRMLGAVGGAEVLPTVEHLARSSRPGPTSKVAERSLPTVRERALRERESATLLRPAMRSGGDTLLRPALGVQGDGGRLLRPAERERPEQ